MNVEILELKKLGDKDLEFLNTLLVHLDNKAEKLSEKDVLSIIGSNSTYLFVAKRPENGEIIGMITLVMYRIPFSKKGILEDLVVHEIHRGMGIGKKLISHAIDYAREHGVTYVDLTSRPQRVDANKLYMGLGFEKRNTNVYRKML